MTATDPFIIVANAISLIAVALVACLIPVRGGAKVDPITALRYE